MKMKFLTWLGALLLTSLGSVSSWAAPGDTFTCSMTTPVYAPAAAYSPFATSVNVTEVKFTVSCFRNFKQADTLNYRVSVNNGLNNLNANPNKAINLGATSTLPYDLHTANNCNSLWDAAPYITGSISWAKDVQTSVSSTEKSFFMCIPAGSTSVFPDSHTDTLTFTITNSVTGTPTVTTVPVKSTFTIGVNKECSTNITALNPLVVDFGAYIAFGGAKPASASFKAKCTNTTAYTMALTDGSGAALTNGVVAGLNYSLALSANGDTGIGSDKTHTINGTMLGGQAGSCALSACTGTSTNTSHYLTITY